MNYEITITRSDGKQTMIELSHPALDLLISCADIGFEGAEGNLAHIDDVSAAIDELTEMRDEAEWTPQETALVGGQHGTKLEPTAYGEPKHRCTPLGMSPEGVLNELR